MYANFDECFINLESSEELATQLALDFSFGSGNSQLKNHLKLDVKTDESITAIWQLTPTGLGSPGGCPLDDDCKELVVSATSSGSTAGEDVVVDVTASGSYGGDGVVMKVLVKDSVDGGGSVEGRLQHSCYTFNGLQVCDTQSDTYYYGSGLFYTETGAPCSPNDCAGCGAACGIPSGCGDAGGTELCSEGGKVWARITGGWYDGSQQACSAIKPSACDYCDLSSGVIVPGGPTLVCYFEGTIWYYIAPSWWNTWENFGCQDAVRPTQCTLCDELSWHGCYRSSSPPPPPRKLELTTRSSPRARPSAASFRRR